VANVQVCKDAVQGVGGFSDSYIHSVRISLLHPTKSTQKKPVIAWSSKLTKVPFVDKLEYPHGLLGMDIIRDWRGLNFELTDETNDFSIFYFSAMQKTNGFVLYTVPADHTNDAYGALINAFTQIGIKTEWSYKPEWVSPNHRAIFIRQKPQ
jgi:hypothetical protein